MSEPVGIARRDLLAGAGAVAAAALVVPRAWAQAPGAAAAALREAFGGRPVQPGKVKLSVPVLAENGNSVQVTVGIEGGGIEGGAVPRRIVLVAPGNPHPLATEIRFGPRAAKGEATLRLRLARSQTVVAGAELADGSLWAATADITVTSGACAETFE